MLSVYSGFDHQVHPRKLFYAGSSTMFPISDWLGLEDGPNELQGRAICFLNNLWGTICDVSFSVQHWPETLCVDLGYRTALTAVHATSTSVGKGSGHIAWTMGGCTRPHGLKLCLNAQGTCNHNQDVVIRCTGNTPYWP